MKIRNRQKFGFACRKPFLCAPLLAFRTMSVAAAIIRNMFMCTVLALFDMPTEPSGPANLNRGHHASLVQAHVTGVDSTPRLPVKPKDIGYLQHRPQHCFLPIN